MDRIATFIGLAFVFSPLFAPALEISPGTDELLVQDSFGGSVELLRPGTNILVMDTGLSGPAEVLMDLTAGADDWVNPLVLPPIYLGGEPDDAYPFGELAASLELDDLEFRLPEPQSVPEPGTIWLLGLALLGLAYFKKPAIQDQS